MTHETHKGTLLEVRDAGNEFRHRWLAGLSIGAAAHRLEAALNRLDALIAALNPEQIAYLCSLEQTNAEEAIDIMEIMDLLHAATQEKK